MKLFQHGTFVEAPVHTDTYRCVGWLHVSQLGWQVTRVADLPFVFQDTLGRSWYQFDEVGIGWQRYLNFTDNESVLITWRELPEKGAVTDAR